MAKKYRRHRWSLLVLIGGELVYAWSADIIISMLKMFRRVEYYWNYYKDKCFKKKRYTFFSYPTLIYQFLKQLDQDAPECLLLRSVVLRENQYNAYQRICSYTGYTCFK